MKFSVLIAHYNNAKPFKDCYDSLLKQTYTNWEAIIIDDFSNENEKILVKKTIENDQRFKFYENKINCGVGITKSKLIELATSEICGFLDPDDAILPDAIKDAIKIFQNKKNVVLTYSRFMKCDENLNAKSPFKSAMQVQNGDNCFFNFPIQIAHFVCFRKDIYETTDKMNPNLKISEDQDLYLKMYEKGDVFFIDKTNYLYRMHAEGISQNNNKKQSYENFGQVIFDAMKRRGLKEINGKKIPEIYTNSKEIFSLLEYQHSVSYRIIKKIKILFQNLSLKNGLQ